MNQTIVMNRAGLSAAFSTRFGNSPSVIFRAPGRANIIGEHVDYSSPFRRLHEDGHNYSMPFALPFGVCVSAAKTDGKKVRVHSANFDQTLELDPKNLPAEPSKISWENYVYGVFSAAQQAGLPITSGLDMQICGDVPIGAGISSSAALTVAQHMMLNRLFSWDRSKADIAKLAQAAEHSMFVGTKCGLLDQTASLFSEDGRAILIDYGDMKNIQTVDLSPLTRQGYKFLLVNSGVERLLGGTHYNDRRAELESAGRGMAAALDHTRPYVSQYEFADLQGLNESFYRYVDMNDLPPHLQDKTKGEVAGTLYKRARFVLAEKQRTLDFFGSLSTSTSDHDAFYTNCCCMLINDCGKGLSQSGDYQISATVMPNEERHYMDLLREIFIDTIMQSPEYNDTLKLFGTRLMGGGGGGNLIALLPNEYDTPALRQAVADRYLTVQEEKGYGTTYDLEYYEANPSAGAGEVTE